MNYISCNIILSDNTQIHATLNGNNFITDDTVSMDILSDENLTQIVINDICYTDITCTNIWTEDGHTRFIIRKKTEAEKLKQCIIDLCSLL